MPSILNARALVEAIADPVVVLDGNWCIVALNGAAGILFDARRDALDGLTLWRAWPASSEPAISAHLHEAMSSHQPVHREHRLQGKNGARDLLLDINAAPFASGLCLVIRDITTQRRAEEHARLIQNLTAALSAALDPESAASVIIERAMPAVGANAGNVYLIDDDQRDLVSIAALGYSPAMLAAARRLPRQSATMMADVVRTRSPIFFESWVERLAHYPHHREVHALGGDRAAAGLPLRVEGRAIGALSLTFPTDHTFDSDERRFMMIVADLCAQALERTRLYDALRRSEAQARLVTDRAPAYIAHIDPFGRYLYVNQGFAQRLGLSPEAVVGKRIPEVVGEAAYAVMRHHLERALAGHEVEFEATIPYAGLGPRFVQVGYAPDRDERGRVRGVVAVVIDATDRQRSTLARQFLADAGAVLGSSLDPETILTEITRIATPGFADLCATWIQEGGALRRVGQSPADPALEGFIQEPHITWMTYAGEPGLPTQLPGKDHAPEQENPLFEGTENGAGPSSMTILLRDQDLVLGAMQFVMTDPARQFGADDPWHAEELGRRCAAALENSRLYHSLQESESRFRQLADAIPNLAWVTGPDGGTLEYINQRWADLIGAEMAAGATPLSNRHVHPDDSEGVERRWAEALRDGSPFTNEQRLLTANGTYRWFLFRSEPVQDAAGTIVKWFGTATDIDDTRRAGASQRFLADLSSTLAESLDPSEILHRVTRLIIPKLADYCFIDLVSPRGQVQRSAWAHVDPDEQRRLDEGMPQFVPEDLDRSHPNARVVATGEPWLVPEVDDAWLQQIAYSPEHLVFIRDRKLRSRLSMPLRARGRTLGALTLCFSAISGRRYSHQDLDLARDIAERIAFAVDNARLYTEAREAEAKVSRLLDAGVVGVIVADRQQVLEANDHFLEMVGYTRAELESGRLRWPSMTAPEFASLDERGANELLESGICTPYEKEYVRGDGTRIPVLTGAAVLKRDPLRWIGFILDLTERKRGEEEWRAFIDATAHDLRNPLTAVLGQTQLLQRRLRRRGGLEPTDTDTRLRTVAAAAVRAAGLIDDLIDTARLRADQSLELYPAPLDLRAMVVACVDEARRVGPSHAILIEVEPSPIQILADERRIERVIRNMLDNAVKFSPDGGDISVHLRHVKDDSGAWAFLSIADQGLGIPATDLANVFDRFRRGANVIGRIHGSGIGLTGAQHIVEQHGGSITVESTEGAGSTFTLRLPLLADGG